jgi:hypothetical protein
VPPLLPEPRSWSWSGVPLPAQGYRLSVSASGAVESIEAADAAGEFYANATLAQLRRSGVRGPCRIEDWPDVAVRGVMLDVSRDKVPTISTLETLIDRLASLKVNHVELYMEHTFAYSGHEEVWSSSGAYTAADLRRLDAFCRARFVELTPNQNCLGHMERWLRFDRYRPLAIAPDGWTDGRGRVRPPTTIDPANPGSLALVRSLLAELLDCFTSRRVHLGLDEPWELPDDRFGEYVDYLARLRGLPELDGFEALVWGDIVSHHPDGLGGLPSGVTVCDWGYEADSPFASRAAWLAGGERPFWLCPGTSSWNSLVGRTSNMLTNCASAASAAREHGASGFLVTDWGDNGHLQYLPVSEPGFAYGAAVSWCHQANVDLDLASALSAHVFDDPTGELASALLALGDAHRLVVPQVANASVLTMHLVFSPNIRMGEGLTEGLTVADLDAVSSSIADARAAIARSAPGRADGDLVKAELDTSARLLELLVDDCRARLLAGGRLSSVDASIRSAFAARLADLADEHRAHWLARNRPEGLADSTSRLTRLHTAYLA